jgi:predicted nucleotidyltransferase
MLVLRTSDHMLTRSATTPTLAQLRARRDEILRIAARHGARNVRVFGSVAVGYAAAGSDIDLLVDLEPGRTLLDLGELEADLEAALGRKVDVLETPRRRTKVAIQIRREAVPL